MKILQPIGSELLYLTLISFIFLVRITPRPIAITVGRLLGVATWAFVPYYRKLVKIQMKNALGSGYSWLLPLKAFMNFGIIPVDIVKFSYLNEAEVKKRLLVDGMENVASAVSDGRAIMIISGHISNWEILANVAIFIGSKLHLVMAIQRDPKLESIFKSIRGRLHGVEVLPPKGGMVSALIETLKQGKHIGMMVDQRHQKKYGLVCDMLGMPAITTPAPAFIALKGDAIILPVSASKGAGKTYRVCFGKPIDPREFGTIDDNIERLTDGAQTEAVQNISDTIQAWLTSVIRTYPDHWLWLHSRWVRRKYMKKILKDGLDFREFVFKQAEMVKQEFSFRGGENPKAKSQRIESPVPGVRYSKNRG
jgi:KDO2-lipid IV(A) lauroyltransferase